MRLAQWHRLALLLSVGMLPTLSAAQCTNIAGSWTGTETGTVTLSLSASDGESSNETDPVSGSGVVTIAQTGTCAFQYSPLATSGSALVNSNLTPSQLAQLVRTVTVSGNNVTETGVFAILNTAAAAQQGLNITAVTGNVETGTGQVDTSHAPWKISMTGSANMVVTGNAVSNGQTVTFTLTVAAATTVTFTQNNSLTLSPPSQTGVAAGLAYVQPFSAAGGSGTGYDWCVLSGSTCAWSGTPLPAGFSLAEYTGYLLSSGDPIAAPGAYPFTVQVKDSAGNTAQVDFTLTIGCAVTFPTQPQYGLQPVSGVQYGPKYMVRQFIAPPNPNNTTSTTRLLDYAQACGFTQFNWQQQWTALPAVSSLLPAAPSLVPDNVYPANCSNILASQWPSSCYLVAGPAFDTGNAQDYPNLFDPPEGGYVNPKAPAGYDPYPFYYPLNEVKAGVASCTLPPQNNVAQCPAFPYVLSPDGTTLSFLDDPAIKGLPNQPASFLPPPGHYVSFITSLVGVSPQSTPGSSICAADSLLYCTTLESWTWNSTFNGTAGGVSQSASFAPIDPGSGTGEVQVTSINGIPTPTVTVTPSAPSIAPTDNLTVSVQVTPLSGNALLIGSILLSSGTYQSLAVHVGGAATFHLPASYLAMGTDTFTALFTPDPESATSFSQAWGTAVVTVGTALPGPTVTVTPASTSIASAQSLSVSVSVSGESGKPTATGTVTLSGGGYTSPVASLAAGGATIIIPANSLSPGSDVLTVQYTPDTDSASTYGSGTGVSAPVTVSASPAAATPTFSPDAGTYNTSISVSISDANAGASIYYTADGTIPTASSTVYSGPIVVSTSEGLRAIAIASGYAPSPVGVASYVINPVSGGAYEWAWMGGPDTLTCGSSGYCVSPGTYGTLGTPAASNLPPNRGEAAAWTDKNGNRWLFGGVAVELNGVYIYYNDMWEYGAASGNWTWMGGSDTVGTGSDFGEHGVYGTQGTAAPGNIPGSRAGATTWTDTSGNLWLFGGRGLDANGVWNWNNDLWKFSPATNQWDWVGGNSTAGTDCDSFGDCGRAGVYGTEGTAAAGNIPGSRASACGWQTGDGQFWMIGGTGVDAAGTIGDLNDLWRFSPANGQWTWVSGTNLANQEGVYGTQGTAAAGNIPSGRSDADCWIDGSGHFWFFGGTHLHANDNVNANDLWEYDPTANLWTWMGGISADTYVLYGIYGTQGVPALGNFPGGRSMSQAWTDSSGNLWLFGGTGVGASGYGGGLNDLWEYVVSANEWAWMGGSNIVATSCLQFGRCGPSGVYGTLGVAAATNTPGGRYGASGWQDAQGDFWIFGGSGIDAAGNYGYLNDLWEFEPAGMLTTAATPGISPPGGTYTSVQTVTLSDSTANAVMYYTLDGSAPGTSSTQYTGPITISSSTTLKAVAAASGYMMSAVSSATYTINLPPPDFSVSGTAVTVTAGATSGNTSSITVTPLAGFSGTVTLSAALASSPSNVVNPPTMSFGANNKVSISSTTAQTAVLSISTTAATQSAYLPSRRNGQGWRAAGGMVLACAFLGGIVSARRRWKTMTFGLLLSIAVVAGVSACGGGGSPKCSSCGSQGTTPGSYTISVTAVSGSTTKTATISLTVH
jgi:hypothetical protein